MPTPAAHEDCWQGFSADTGTDDARETVSGPLATIDG